DAHEAGAQFGDKAGAQDVGQIGGCALDAGRTDSRSPTTARSRASQTPEDRRIRRVSTHVAIAHETVGHIREAVVHFDIELIAILPLAARGFIIGGFAGLIW